MCLEKLSHLLSVCNNSILFCQQHTRIMCACLEMFFWQSICVTHCSFWPISEDVFMNLSITKSLIWKTPARGCRHQQTGYVRCLSLVMMQQNSIDYFGTSDTPLVADNSIDLHFCCVHNEACLLQTSSVHTCLSQHVLFLTPSLRPQLVREFSIP